MTTDTTLTDALTELQRNHDAVRSARARAVLHSPDEADLAAAAIRAGVEPIHARAYAEGATQQYDRAINQLDDAIDTLRYAGERLKRLADLAQDGHR